MHTSGRQRHRGVLRAVALGALVVAGLALPSTPVQAHPFGDPQIVAVTRDDSRPDVVRVRWKVGGLDDLTLLGVSLGLLPRDRVLLDGAVIFQPSDATAVGPSPKFSSYLLQQITVAGDGHRCAGVVQRPSDVAKSGVTIDYTCPGPVGKATLTVKTLTDLNPAYRTLATGPSGERAVYGDGRYSHDWTLGAEAGRGHTARDAAVQIALVAGGVLLVALVAVPAVRRLQRRKVGGRWLRRDG